VAITTDPLTIVQPLIVSPNPGYRVADEPLDGHVPDGPVDQLWERHKFEMKLVNPANRRRYRIIVVGSGLAGGSAAATLGELGYQVSCFCYQDSPRRAHSIAAQGGINAAKNYRNDGDSVYRLFYDTVKGGDFRSREANVYRLAELSANIIDQCVAQGVPFAREYGGLLDTRSFGGAQVSRTFYARGQTGQQLELGAYQALTRQIRAGTVTMYARHEMLELVVIDGRARGIVTRDLVTGEVESHVADVVVLATGGYSNVFYLSTNARGCNVTAIWRAYKKGAAFANPCYTQIHPTCIPQSGDYQSKLTLMSESLRNDGRVWVPRESGDERPPAKIPEDERDYFLERKYPSFGNLAPRDIASRSAKEVCDAGLGVGPGGRGVYLDFADAIGRVGADVIRERYGNLFDIYERITGDDPYRAPMRIYPAPHYTMGGLWVDYDLQSTIPGLFVIGEANFSDHGANRLGASALMQGLADGYFIAPATVSNFLAGVRPDGIDTKRPEFREAENEVYQRVARLLAINGERTVDSFHRELGTLMWNNCGMARSGASLRECLTRIPEIREEFWQDIRVPGGDESLNQSLERAGRVADFLEMAELLALDALHRTESCGGHFRVESQTEDGEALRDDAHFAYVAAWEYDGYGYPPVLHKEPLTFNEVHLAQRSYK
jgi:succinate dehydrogenase / fumarate reductase flavoprotein subunit